MRSPVIGFGLALCGALACGEGTSPDATPSGADPGASPPVEPGGHEKASAKPDDRDDAGTGPVPACPQTSCDGRCADTTTDKDNCGVCGRRCETSCAAGMCKAATLGPDGLLLPVDPYMFVLDGDAIYYVSSDKSIVRQTKDKASRTVLAPPSPTGSIERLEVRDGTAYFVERNYDTSEYAIRALTPGMRTVTLAKTDRIQINRFHVSSSHAYVSSICSTVYAVPLTGGSFEALNNPSCNVFGAIPFVLDPAKNTAYSSFLGLGSIDYLFELPLVPHAQIERIEQPLHTDELAVDATTVFFVDQGTCEDDKCNGGVLGRLGRDGSGYAVLVDMRTFHPATYRSMSEPVVDDAHVYFSLMEPDERTLGIYRLPKAGGSPTLLYRNADVTRGHGEIAVDAGFIYFLEHYTLSRIPK